MRTDFDLAGQSFESLATEDEATRWALVDRAFPTSTDSAAIQASLVKASYWLRNIIEIPDGDVSEPVARCVVRLATYFAGDAFEEVGPSPVSMSNSDTTINMRCAGQQDRDEANRFGFPDVESYRLVSHLINRGRGDITLKRATSYTEVRPF